MSDAKSAARSWRWRGPKKPIAADMNHVTWNVCSPCLSLPADIRCIAAPANTLLQLVQMRIRSGAQVAGMYGRKPAKYRPPAKLRPAAADKTPSNKKQ